MDPQGNHDDEPTGQPDKQQDPSTSTPPSHSNLSQEPQLNISGPPANFHNDDPYPGLQKLESANYPILQNQESQQNQELRLEYEGAMMDRQKQFNSKGLLICVDDSDTIPSVVLEPSPKGHQPLVISIPSYRTSVFMKLETHFYQLEVRDANIQSEYSIQRRFSEFVDLYETIFYNQPGYILCPFPGKSLDSFIKLKLGLGTTEPGERCQMIQKRMSQLQKFINFLTHHHELSNCEELAVFLEKDAAKYESGKKRLQKYMEEYKTLQKNSHLKAIFEKSKSLWSYYFSKQEEKHMSIRQSISVDKSQIQFRVILQNIKGQQTNVQSLLQEINLLLKAEKSFSEFSDFQTDNDALLKVCAKQSSSKDFCRKFANFLEIQVLEGLTFSHKCLEQVEKSLIYRLNIVEALEDAKKEGIPEKVQKLERRLQRLERNFRLDWSKLYSEVTRRNKQMRSKLSLGWSDHKEAMRKIWKKKN